jgi:UDP-glucose 4-epimerase
MKYLVTGGAGFIGSNLIKDLIKEKHKIIVVDDISTGSLDNLKEVKDKIVFVRSSVGNVLKMKQLKNLDGIFHLGIPSASPLYKKDHFLTSRAISDFISILELAKRENCKLVFASSSSVYNGNKIPYKEDQPIFVMDLYTEARYLMERLSKLYYDFFKTRTIGLRFFSVYGPGEESKKYLANLVSQFLWEIKKNRSPVIYGNGKQKRDFIYVGDIIRGMKLAMKSKIDFDIFNLGTGKTCDLNELVALLNKVMKKKIKATYVRNTVKNYISTQKADTRKAAKLLKFKSKVSLEQGIKNLLKNN